MCFDNYFVLSQNRDFVYVSYLLFQYFSNLLGSPLNFYNTFLVKVYSYVMHDCFVRVTAILKFIKSVVLPLYHVASTIINFPKGGSDRHFIVLYESSFLVNQSRGYEMAAMPLWRIFDRVYTECTQPYSTSTVVQTLK